VFPRRLSIEDLAAEIGWSRRHLGRRFRHHIGLPPKTLSRVFRLQTAMELLRDHAQVSTAEPRHPGRLQPTRRTSSVTAAR